MMVKAMDGKHDDYMGAGTGVKEGKSLVTNPDSTQETSDVSRRHLFV